MSVADRIQVQIIELRDENDRLRRRCEILEQNQKGNVRLKEQLHKSRLNMLISMFFFYFMSCFCEICVDFAASCLNGLSYKDRWYCSIIWTSVLEFIFIVMRLKDYDVYNSQFLIVILDLAYYYSFCYGEFSLVWMSRSVRIHVISKLIEFLKD